MTATRADSHRCERCGGSFEATLAPEVTCPFCGHRQTARIRLKAGGAHRDESRTVARRRRRAGDRGERGAVVCSAGSIMGRQRYTIVLVCAYALVVAILVLGLLERQPYDDAWFFKRFAYNLLEHGSFAWNVEDGPVHGNTSQLFQLIAVPVYAVAGDAYTAAMRLLLAAALVAGFFALVRLARCAVYEGAGGAREGGAAAAALMFVSPIALFTALSGMETALVLLALSSFMLALRVIPPRGWGQLAAPVGMLCVYLLRPDAVLLAAMVWAWDRAVLRRQLPIVEGLCFAAVFAAALVGLWAFYGSPLPLSFYLKSGHLTVYSESFIELSAEAKRKNVAFFAVVAAPLLYLALQRVDRRNGGLLIAAAAFVAYHLASTVEVMGGHARFYAPALPLLAAAAAYGFDAARTRARVLMHGAFLMIYTAAVWFLHRAEVIPDATVWIIERVEPAHYVAYVGGAWIAILGAWWRPRLAAGGVLAAAAVAMGIAYPIRAPALPPDTTYLEAQLAQRSGFRDIGKVRACLGEEITLYHSEIGLPGVMFPEATITDLAALMTPDLVFGKTTFDELCAREAPEVIYLPHRVYDTLNDEILTSACIEEYTEVRGDSSSPLYIRNDLLSAYRSCPGP